MVGAVCRTDGLGLRQDKRPEYHHKQSALGLDDRSKLGTHAARPSTCSHMITHETNTTALRAATHPHDTRRIGIDVNGGHTHEKIVALLISSGWMPSAFLERRY